MKIGNKKLILIILLLTISLGYALLNATLTINGNSKIIQQSWDIHWNNVQVTNGSVSIGTDDSAAVITPGDTTEVTYEVTLSQPGDFYEFTVDAVNGGSVDAMIDTITSTYKIGDGAVTTITANNLPAYLEYSVAYSDGTALAQYQELKANTTETYKVRVGYKKDISVNDLPSTAQSIVLSFGVEYVQADSNAIAVVSPAVSFATDSWETIAYTASTGNACTTGPYSVGDTKTINMGALGTHTVRIANCSTPSICSTSGFSQTACGFVLEFTDIIDNQPMSESGTNDDGWPYSDVRTYVNGTVYNALPSELKSAITDTTVVSSHGPNNGSNFTSTDRLYLLSVKEVNFDEYDETALNETRVLDYYALPSPNYSKSLNNQDGPWWLRSAYGVHAYGYYDVFDSNLDFGINASDPYGVSPAFRIG